MEVMESFYFGSHYLRQEGGRLVLSETLLGVGGLEDLLRRG